MKSKRIVSGVLAFTTALGIAMAQPNMALAKGSKTGTMKSSQSIGNKKDNDSEALVVEGHFDSVTPISEFTEILPEEQTVQTPVQYTEVTPVQYTEVTPVQYTVVTPTEQIIGEGYSITEGEGLVQVIEGEGLVETQEGEGLVEIKPEDETIKIEPEDGLVEIKPEEGYIVYKPEEGHIEVKPEEGYYEVSPEGEVVESPEGEFEHHFGPYDEPIRPPFGHFYGPIPPIHQEPIYGPFIAPTDFEIEPVFPFVQPVHPTQPIGPITEFGPVSPYTTIEETEVITPVQPFTHISPITPVDVHNDHNVADEISDGLLFEYIEKYPSLLLNNKDASSITKLAK